MKTNMFNFIQFYLATSKNRVFSTSRLVSDRDKKSRPYFRFELKNEVSVVISNCTLIDHHISFYELNAQSRQSPYHYTGHFVDASGAVYQLHVYFDVDDNIISPPIFSIKDTRGSFTPVLSEEHHEDFISLARCASKAVITELRRQFALKIQELEQTYHDVELEASRLSENIDGAYEQYIAKLEEVSHVLDKIIHLVKYSHYEKTANFIKQIRAYVVQQHDLLLQSDVNEATFVDEPTKTDALSSQVLSAKIPREITSPQEITSIDSSIHELALQFTQLNTDDNDSYTKGLMDILRRTYDIPLLLTEKQYSASSDAVKKLQELKIKLVDAGEKLFPRLLLTNNFHLVREMENFRYMLTTKYLSLALLKGDHDLLDFLLDFGDFRINTERLTINQKDYMSAVDYCVQSDSVTKPMLQCLTLLIKYGASMLTRDKQGIPLAHSILSIPSHPLRLAFFCNEINRSKTVESIAFNKELVAALRQYLSAQRVPKDEQEVIEQAINSYSRKIETIMGFLPIATVQERLLAASSSRIKDKFAGMEKMEKLQIDPAINAKKACWNAELRKLPSATMRKALSMQKPFIDLLVKGDSKAIEALSFEKIRSMVLEDYDKNIQHLRNAKELESLTKTLSSPTSTISARRKRLFVRATELAHAIEERNREVISVHEQVKEYLKEKESEQEIAPDIFFDRTESTVDDPTFARALTQFHELGDVLARGFHETSTSADAPVADREKMMENHVRLNSIFSSRIAPNIADDDDDDDDAVRDNFKIQ